MQWIKIIEQLSHTNEIFAIATVAQVGGSAPREEGTKIIVLANGDFHLTIGGGELEKQVINQSIECIKKKENGYFTYPLGAKTGQCCGGVVDVFIEVIENKNPNLFIFGQGHVGLAIAKVLEDCPINLTGIDSRDEWLEKSKTLNISSIKYDNFDRLEIPSSSACVVLTHSHDLDFDLVNFLCQRDDLSYIGLIGSQSKWIRFQRRLQEAGRTEKEISRITCPIGVPIPGKSPAEIAISFGAQILQVLNGKN